MEAGIDAESERPGEGFAGGCVPNCPETVPRDGRAAVTADRVLRATPRHAPCPPCRGGGHRSVERLLCARSLLAAGRARAALQARQLSPPHEGCNSGTAVAAGPTRGCRSDPRDRVLDGHR